MINTGILSYLLGVWAVNSSLITMALSIYIIKSLKE